MRRHRQSRNDNRYYQDSWVSRDDRPSERYSRNGRGTRGYREEGAPSEYDERQVWENADGGEWSQRYRNQRGSYGNHNYSSRSPSSWHRHSPDPQRGSQTLGQRRLFSSSTSRTASARDANRSSAGTDSTPSLASRLFQHRDTLIRFDPVDLIRNRGRRATPSPPPPHLDLKSTETKMGPSEEYLTTSLEKSEAIDEDTNADAVVRKLLVLDLNGTLVYRSPPRLRRAGHFSHGAVAEDVYAQSYSFHPRRLRTVHPRPYLNSFRDYLFHPNTKCWLDTMVWSSAQPHSVSDMVEKCFGKKMDDLVAVWARDRLGLDARDYNRKVQTIKDLRKAWDELDSIFSPEDPPNSSEQSPPPSQQRHSAKSTILLDDSSLKAHLQPYNHLCLKEYDQQMRKHDLDVRELELERERYAEALAGKETIDETPENTAIDEHSGLDRDLKADLTSVQDESLAVEEYANGEDGSRKRKRKEKKENKKREQIEQAVRRLKEEQADGVHVYDETLLAVVGILDAVKLETNVAAWVRSGGLLQADSRSHWFREESVDSNSTTSSGDDQKALRKKARVSWEAGVESPSRLLEDSAASLLSHDPPPPSSSLPREISQSESDAELGTEHTGVPVDDPQTVSGGTKTVEAHLWFNQPGTLTYWATRGRRVLENMGIDVLPGIG